MSIRTTIVALETSITRSTTKFTDARTRRPAFAPYPTAAALGTVLAARASLGAAERSALLCTLLSEQQKARHTLWQALLLVAFEPMLLRLRSQIRRRPDEDADQAVIIAFLEATTTVTIGPFAPLAMKLQHLRRDPRRGRQNRPRRDTTTPWGLQRRRVGRGAPSRRRRSPIAPLTTAIVPLSIRNRDPPRRDRGRHAPRS